MISVIHLHFYSQVLPRRHWWSRLVLTCRCGRRVDAGDDYADYQRQAGQ